MTKKIQLKIKDYMYIDGDLLSVSIKDDRGVVYEGTLEIKKGE